MTFEEISEKAFKRESLGEYNNLAEKYAYLQLYNLYRDYHNKIIDKKNSIKQKNKIEKEFEENQKKINNYYDVFKKQNEIRIKYNKYITEIEKSQNQDEILEKSLKFIEIIIADPSFYDRNIKK